MPLGSVSDRGRAIDELIHGGDSPVRRFVLDDLDRLRRLSQSNIVGDRTKTRSSPRPWMRRLPRWTTAGWTVRVGTDQAARTDAPAGRRNRPAATGEAVGRATRVSHDPPCRRRTNVLRTYQYRSRAQYRNSAILQCCDITVLSRLCRSRSKIEPRRRFGIQADH